MVDERVWYTDGELPVKNAVYGRNFLRSPPWLIAGEVQVFAMTPEGCRLVGKSLKRRWPGGDYEYQALRLLSSSPRLHPTADLLTFLTIRSP